ncbi:Putative nitrite reductase large subunit [Ignavibacterium album JCM 16511]|uniref:Putative nitrite reductase large subunit n=1 Tax=Ignavibacterium album (strain DSM 19864 / JCM 16511 / NBRC 101810 / Mat9-16) TaxID=945713 RepID=I0AP02_IGNAJ|nr:NAD(P)/FAD-dependent oxidoreductase [Ignavibacterium album]AFH50709.1 Putative nitrite reductase large subunit [Ignavibacterium album JCM 16511]
MQKYNIVIYGLTEAALVCANSAAKTYPDKNIALIFPDNDKKFILLLAENLASNSNGRISVLHKSITSREANILILDDNEIIGFEKLVIATGSSPIKPNIKGIEKEGVFLIDKDFQSINRTKKLALKCEKIVVFGGDYLGVEFTDELLREGKSVTIIERSNRLLPSSFDSEISLSAQYIIESQGGAVILNNKVKEVIGNNRVESVKLRNEETLNCDFLLISSGSRPNVEVAEKLKIVFDYDRGILIDDYFRTSDKDIFAIGDCAAKFDFFRGDLCSFLMQSLKLREAELVGSNVYSVIYNRGKLSSYLTYQKRLLGRIKNRENEYEKSHLSLRTMQS